MSYLDGSTQRAAPAMVRNGAASAAAPVGGARSSPPSGGAEDAWRRGGEDAVLAKERLGVQGEGCQTKG